MSGRDEYLEAAELARSRLDNFRAKYDSAVIHMSKDDLIEFENYVREYHLRSAALRLYDIYDLESDKYRGQWSNADYFTYYKCASLLCELARLGEVFYDIQNKGLTNDEDYV